MNLYCNSKLLTDLSSQCDCKTGIIIIDVISFRFRDLGLLTMKTNYKISVFLTQDVDVVVMVCTRFSRPILSIVQKLKFYMTCAIHVYSSQSKRVPSLCGQAVVAIPYNRTTATPLLYWCDNE